MRLRTIECKESNRDAFKLGLAAAVILALAHVTSNLLSGCICTSFMEELETSSSTKRKIWFACHIFSWYLRAFQFSSLLSVYSSVFSSLLIIFSRLIKIRNIIANVESETNKIKIIKKGRKKKKVSGSKERNSKRYHIGHDNHH